ncbi:hypothetical protein Agub_g15189 [Astrephomene gubernaculifera]|uniref:Uncharacterized protein n=1 Tax=Astrephomene gubernaculifera TaxID=47775 RepID=A0AAD3HTI8_9CHLO|nr:hypothetical protein Agub_g15189 [Astrephomene gubernaculifera]
MSSLAQRQWRQRAQSAVRSAMTAVREARSRFQELSDAGDSALSSLANTGLQLAHLPATRLPPALATLRPELRAAAAGKLVRQLVGMLGELQERVRQLEGCVAALGAAVGSLEGVAQDEPWMRSTPVFHTMPLPKVRQLLTHVYDMHRLEYDSKAAVAAAFAGLFAAPIEAAEAAAAEAQEEFGVGGAGSVGRRADPRGVAALAVVGKGGAGGGKTGDAKRLSDLCTTYISVWMLAPYLEDEQAEEFLGAIGEDMVSF